MGNDISLHKADARSTYLSWVFLSSFWGLLLVLPSFLAQKTATPILVGSLYGLAVVSLLSHALLGSPSEPENVAEAALVKRRWLKRLVWIWGLMLVGSQAAIVVRIMLHRDGTAWPLLTEICQLLVDHLSPFLPALRKLPSDMIRSGYKETALLVTDSFALAYAAALINMAIAVPILGMVMTGLVRSGDLNVLHGFGQLPWTKKVGAFLGWPFLTALYIYANFLTTGVDPIPGRKEQFPNFETDAVHLYFRALIGTGLGTVCVIVLICIMVMAVCVWVTKFSARFRNPA